MTNVTTPVPHNEVRKTVIYNTIDRIHHKPRSLQSYDPMEDFLNERSVTVSQYFGQLSSSCFRLTLFGPVQSFEDVSRSIRANTAALLKKVHTPIPRAVRPLSISNEYKWVEHSPFFFLPSPDYPAAHIREIVSHNFLYPYFSHIETPISERISSDEYIWHLLRPLPGRQHNGIDVGYYPETSTHVPLGKKKSYLSRTP